MQPHQHNNLYGIFFIIINAAFVAILYAAMKFESGSLSSNQVVFFYKTLVLLLIIPWVFKEGIKSIYTDQIKLHLIRGFLSISGSLSFMYGLRHIDMTDATALGYLEQVLLVAIGMLYFNEAKTKSKVFCVLASLMGAFIVLYSKDMEFEDGWIPVFSKDKGFKNFNHYYLYILLGVLCWTLNCIVVKLMGKTERTKVQLFYVTLFSCIFAFPFAFFEWESVRVLGLNISMPGAVIPFDSVGLKVEHFKYIALIAFCYFGHNISFFKAFKYAEMSTIIPFEYTKLLFAGILQYYIYDKVPEHISYIGYALIVGSGILLIKSEAKRRSKQKLDKQIQELNEEYEHA